MELKEKRKLKEKRWSSKNPVSKEPSPLSRKAEPLASLGELEGHSSGMFAVFALWYDSEEKKK